MNNKGETDGRWRWLLSNQTVLWAFVVLGILLRLRQYLFDRSLWVDESMLALNIIRRSPAELLKPLDYSQAAPVGFLWLEKLAVQYLGSGEMALRFVPLLCGIGSVLLFLGVARKFLPQPAIPIAVGLFAVSEPLIYYSSEVKQYSSDVAFALILYQVANSLVEVSFGFAGATLVALIGGVVIWFSNPAVFILAGLGLSAFWISARKRDKRALVLLLIPAVVWSCSFLVYYIFFLRDVITQNRGLFFYWRSAFAPFPPSSSADVLWYVTAFVNIISFPTGSLFPGIAAVAAILGVAKLHAGNQGRFLLLLSPMAVTLIASWLHCYPFENRLLLFMVPAIILSFAVGLETIHSATRKTLPLLSVLFVGFLLLYPSLKGIWHFAKPKGVEEIRLPLEYVEKHRSKGDILYCYYGAVPAFEYYTHRGLVAPVDEVIGVDGQQRWALYQADLDKLRGQKRVWILFSHIWRTGEVDEEALFLNYLDMIGNRLDSMRATGASAYLYDLSIRGPSRSVSAARPQVLSPGIGDSTRQ
jgi:hypothetical protein